MASRPDPLRARGEDVHVLASFISDTKSLDRVPTCFVRVMEDGAWTHFRNDLGREVKPSDFKAFVETKYPSGLGTTLDTLRKLITGNSKAVDLYNQAVQRKAGGDHSNNDNIMNARQGTSSSYAIRKLRKSAPPIHAKVIKGELSPHAGMVKAGFRKKSIQIPSDPKGAVRILKKHFTKTQCIEIGKALAE